MSKYGNLTIGDLKVLKKIYKNFSNLNLDEWSVQEEFMVYMAELKKRWQLEMLISTKLEKEMDTKFYGDGL